MPYAQIDVSAPRHPKIVELSAAAFRLWVSGLCYCQEFLTDGLLSPQALRVIGAEGQAELVTELLLARLWEHPGGEATGGAGPTRYQFHDYLQWNKSREQVQQEKQGARDRANQSRDRRKKKAEQKAAQQAARQLLAPVRRTCGARHAHGAEPIRNATQRSTPDLKERDLGGTAPPSGPPEPPRTGPHASHAFCGTQLHVTGYLHEEFTDTLGPDALERHDLLAWYRQLDDDLVARGGPPLLPDRDRWLKEQFGIVLRDTFGSVRRRA